MIEQKSVFQESEQLTMDDYWTGFDIIGGGVASTIIDNPRVKVIPKELIADDMVHIMSSIEFAKRIRDGAYPYLELSGHSMAYAVGLGMKSIREFALESEPEKEMLSQKEKRDRYRKGIKSINGKRKHYS